MSESFSVDEIAIAVCPAGADDDYHVHGTEVTVVGALESRWMRDLGCIARCYEVERDGQLFNALPQWLRKKRPPPTREPVSTWDDVIVWKPREVTHV